MQSHKKTKIFMKKNTKSLWLTSTQSYNAVTNILCPAINKTAHFIIILSLSRKIFLHRRRQNLKAGSESIFSWKEKFLFFSICWQKLVDIFVNCIEIPSPKKWKVLLIEEHSVMRQDLMSFLLVALTLLCCPENCHVQGVMEDTW